MLENMTRDTAPFISVTNNNNDHFVMCDDKNIWNKLDTLLWPHRIALLAAVLRASGGRLSRPSFRAAATTGSRPCTGQTMPVVRKNVLFHLNIKSAT